MTIFFFLADILLVAVDKAVTVTTKPFQKYKGAFTSTPTDE
jgi:hypothetical protein